MNNESIPARFGLRPVKAEERLPEVEKPIFFEISYPKGRVVKYAGFLMTMRDGNNFVAQAISYPMRDYGDRITWYEEFESIPSAEPAKAVYSDILVQHWKDEIKTANEKIDEYRLSDPSQLQWWFGYKEAIDNAINKYCSVLSPAEPAKESQPKEELVKFLDWWLLNYMNVKGATPNSTAIVVERYLSESK